MTTKKKYSIRASSYIINLLGDELIGSDSLALFEIVKNSYDADSKIVVIHLNHILSSDGRIVIEDRGNGMTPDVIEHAWLTIGTDYKRKELKQSPIYHRTSLGNKGVGRLAAYRLANKIMVETQPRDDMFGSMLTINWNSLVRRGSSIEDLSVDVEHGLTNLIPGGHGTRITLSDLKCHNWNASKVKSLVSQLQGIQNPFSVKDNFTIEVKSDEPKVQEWIDSVTPSSEIVKNSLFKFEFSISQSNNNEDDFAFLKWNYSFDPINFPVSAKIGQSAKEGKQPLDIDAKEFMAYDKDVKERFFLKNSLLNGIGKITGCFYAFSRDGKILDLIYGAGRRTLINSYLDQNGGVKIFRDNIRVYNYGEPNDDWLGINLNRATKMNAHFAKNQVIGTINLNLAETKDSLVEKTNREGFIENDTFDILTRIVKAIFHLFERTSASDKEKLLKVIDKNSVTRKIGFSETIRELEDKLKQKNLDGEFSDLVGKVKKDYDNMRNVMLSSGMNGLNLTIVFHEVEREMGFIRNDIMKKDCDIENIRLRIKSLMDLMEKFMPLLKQSRMTPVKASKLAERVSSIHKSRFKFHEVLFSNRFTESNVSDFMVKGPGGLILGALSNLIDNAIYWSRERRVREEGFKPAIVITSDINNFDGPALVVADNGRGFQMEPDEMILPFRTLKPSGMGIGLYYVSLVMETIGGKLLFPNAKELGLPEAYVGACVALVFPSNNKI